MILNDLQDALLSVDENVYYGTAEQHPKDKRWDYIVFSRDVISRNDNRTSLTDTVNVAIVREEYIEEGLPETIVDTVEGLKGFRLASGNHEYFYTVKPNTNLVVEMLVLKFTHSRKK